MNDLDKILQKKVYAKKRDVTISKILSETGSGRIRERAIKYHFYFCIMSEVPDSKKCTAQV